MENRKQNKNFFAFGKISFSKNEIFSDTTAKRKKKVRNPKKKNQFKTNAQRKRSQSKSRSQPEETKTSGNKSQIKSRIHPMKNLNHQKNPLMLILFLLKKIEEYEKKFPSKNFCEITKELGNSVFS